MAFVVKQSDTYFWPVEVAVASDKHAGRHDKHTFDAEFKRVSQSRVEEIISLGENAPVSDRELVVEIMVGWKGVTDGTEELPWSEANRDIILNMPKVATAIVTAWTDSLTGARKKN
jgi:hypothetical protein